MRRSLALLLVASPLAAQTSDPVARLDTIFRAYTSATPGCAVGVAQQGRPITERAYGMADLEHDVPNTPTTIFEAGSVSKQFTAGSIVLLALDGKLSIDDDVRKYLPELPTYEKPITIRNLLNHTSGLRDWGSVAALGGWPRTTRVYTNDLVLDIARRQRSLNYTPGEYYSYTNTGFNLLALIVQRLSGMPLAEFTRQRIFTPLGMTRTSWRDDFTRVVKGRAIAYDPAANSPGAFAQDMPFENAYGNGGLLTTPADLLRWTANLETGAVLGGPKFVAIMHEQARLNGGRTIQYAKGLMVDTYRGVREVQHSGSTAGYRAFLARYPQQGVAVAVLCNVATANATLLAHRAADAFLGTLEDQPPVRATQTASVPGAARLAVLVGTYRSTRDGTPLRIRLRDGALRTATEVPLVPASDDRFQLGQSGTALQFDAPGRAGRAGLSAIAADGDTVRYEPVAAFEPTAAQLAEYAGTYVSDEAEASFVVDVDGGRLRLHDRYGRLVDTFTPAYADAFGLGTPGIHFLRDAKGHVTAMRYRESRAWDVRFRKQ